MQTSSYHSAVLQRCFDTARLIRQGGSFTDRYCLPRQPRTQSRSKEAKTCFVLDFSNHQKKNTHLSSVACHWEMKRFVPEEGTLTTGKRELCRLVLTQAGRQGGEGETTSLRPTWLHWEAQRGTRLLGLQSPPQSGHWVLILTGFASLTLLNIPHWN